MIQSRAKLYFTFILKLAAKKSKKFFPTTGVCGPFLNCVNSWKKSALKRPMSIGKAQIAKAKATAFLLEPKKANLVIVGSLILLQRSDLRWEN